MKKAAITGAVAFAVLGWSMIPTAAVRIRNFCRSKKSCDDKYIYLTFDDGPSDRYTPELLDMLKAFEIKATFFVVASQAAENPQLIERMKDEGHMIALHSLEHKCPLFQSARQTQNDMERAVDIMTSLGVDIHFFRPPWGTLNLALKKQIRERGLEMVLWSVMAEDWQADITEDEISERLLSRTGNGSIVCLHDGRGSNDAPARTIAALRKTIPAWKSAGYSFLIIDERDAGEHQCKSDDAERSAKEMRQ